MYSCATTEGRVEKLLLQPLQKPTVLFSGLVQKKKTTNPGISTVSRYGYPTVWVMKQRKVDLLAQGDPAGKLQSWVSNPGSVTPEPMHFITPSFLHLISVYAFYG